MVNGVKQRPMDGVSMAYTFDDAKAKDRHTTQYFEMFGNRAIYREGWWARTIHKAPWESKPRRPLDDNSVKNKSKTITAEIEIPEGTIANGTLLVQGGRFGGWSLYVKDGVPAYLYNFLGLEQTLSPPRRNSSPAHPPSASSSPTMEEALAKAEPARFSSTTGKLAKAASVAPNPRSSPPTRLRMSED